MLNLLIYLMFHTYSGKGEWAVPQTITYQKLEDKATKGLCTCYIWHCEIQINPDFKQKKGLINHERVHARQFGRLLWLHSLLYIISSRYRLASEIEAYQEQVKFYKYIDKREYTWIVENLYRNYDLDMTRREIAKKCDESFNKILEVNR